MAFITGHEAPEVLQPGEEAFDLPAALVPAQGPSVLRDVHPIRAMRRNEFDPALGEEPRIERIRVICAIADQSVRRSPDEELVKGLLDEGDFVRGSTCNAYGERKTIAVCHCHDLGPLAAAGGADAAAPFFAPA